MEKYEAQNNGKIVRLEVDENYGSKIVVKVTENTWLPNTREVVARNLHSEESVKQVLQSEGEKELGKGTRINRI